MAKMRDKKTPRGEIPTGAQLPREIPEGEWVDVTKSGGMIPALGVVPDPDHPGVLRTVDKNGNPYGGAVVWHNKGCKRTGIDPAVVRFDLKGAPWCPTCFAENVARDPSWNTPAGETPMTETPAPQTLSEVGRQRRIEHIRRAREAGMFRDPAQQAPSQEPRPQRDLPPIQDDAGFDPRPERFDG